MTFATFSKVFLNIFMLVFSSEFCSQDQNKQLVFQACASRVMQAFQVEHITCNTSVSIEPTDRFYVNFTCCCYITESKI
jgi:hypothetical protein